MEEVTEYRHATKLSDLPEEFLVMPSPSEEFDLRGNEDRLNLTAGSLFEHINSYIESFRLAKNTEPPQITLNRQSMVNVNWIRVLARRKSTPKLTELNLRYGGVPIIFNYTTESE